MLAATAALKNSTLDLFRLALSMVERGEENIPTSLKDYFSDILIQAKAIALDPNQISNLTKPEAIELAVEIREIRDFQAEIDKVDTIDNMSSDIAKKLLETMEVHPVCQNGFNPFTGFAG